MLYPWHVPVLEREGTPCYVAVMQHTRGKPSSPTSVIAPMPSSIDKQVEQGVKGSWPEPSQAPCLTLVLFVVVFHIEHRESYHSQLHNNINCVIQINKTIRHAYPGLVPICWAGYHKLQSTSHGLRPPSD